ncbi:MAG: DNA adenine methylase, partial [Chloroflexota bacterium]|nr:DNA adenine methylase [Chloroflexota bacterium]
GKSVIADWNETEHLAAVVWRLKQAFIENDDAIKVIKRYDQPHTLFYVDPPYLFDVRSARWKEVAYRYEVDEDYHCRLLKVLKEVRGMVIISGYPSALYEDVLRNWWRVEKSARTTNTAKTAVEVLWLSPAVMEHGQQALFV